MEQNECVFKAVQDMLQRMKEDIATRQSILHVDQIRVAEIYNLMSYSLAEACKIHSEKIPEHCTLKDRNKKPEVTIDTFIFLNQLKDDGLISEQYYDNIFESLIKINPDIEKKVREDKSRGFL